MVVTSSFSLLPTQQRVSLEEAAFTTPQVGDLVQTGQAFMAPHSAYPIASPGPLGGAVSRARAWLPSSELGLRPWARIYPVTSQQGNGGIQVWNVFGPEHHIGKSPVDTAIWLVGT